MAFITDIPLQNDLLDEGDTTTANDVDIDNVD